MRRWSYGPPCVSGSDAPALSASTPIVTPMVALLGSVFMALDSVLGYGSKVTP